MAETARAGGYRGVDVDFEFVYGQDAGHLRRSPRPAAAGPSPPLPLTVALSPKQSDGQAGRLYEGLDFSLLAQAVDFALLMAYDWGWAGGPPGPVSPLPQVRRSVEYALTYFPPERLLLGVPNYGYAWPLPWREGDGAVSVDHVRAVRLAWDPAPAIRWDQEAQAPWFPYVDGEGRRREVWFEDARSWAAKDRAGPELRPGGDRGCGTWTAPSPRGGRRCPPWRKFGRACPVETGFFPAGCSTIGRFTLQREDCSMSVTVGLKGRAEAPGHPGQYRPKPPAPGPCPSSAPPFLCALMEEAAWKSIAPHLEAGQSTVGTRLDISHDSATPWG